MQTSTALVGRSQTAITTTTTVVTSMIIPAPIEDVWNGLMFYEQVDETPPFYLRWLLPVPIRTVGRKSEVGDEAFCEYVGGHLIKRVTQVERGRLYAFAVTEQALSVGNGMKLSSGSYALRSLPDGTTEIAATTNYISERRPRWLWRPLEAQVCHIFHRHILRSMRRKIASGS